MNDEDMLLRSKALQKQQQ